MNRTLIALSLSLLITAPALALDPQPQGRSKPMLQVQEGTLKHEGASIVGVHDGSPLKIDTAQPEPKDSEFKTEGGSVTFHEGTPRLGMNSARSNGNANVKLVKEPSGNTAKSQSPLQKMTVGSEPPTEMPQEHKDKISACETKCAAEGKTSSGLGKYGEPVASNFTPPDPCSKLFYSAESCTPELQKKYEEKQAKHKACFEKCMKNSAGNIPNPLQGLGKPL